MQEEMAKVHDSNTLKKIFNLHHNLESSKDSKNEKPLNSKEEINDLEETQIFEVPKEESDEKMKEENKS